MLAKWAELERLSDVAGPGASSGSPNFLSIIGINFRPSAVSRIWSTGPKKPVATFVTSMHPVASTLA